MAKLLLLLVFLNLGLFWYQTPVTSGSVFVAQCPQVNAATYYPKTGSAHQIRNLNLLMDMRTQPGVWYGYDSPFPFGGDYRTGETRNNWYAKVVTQTPCGEFETWAWDNLDGTLIVFAFADMQGNCDTSGQHCGQHHFEFYYVNLSDWRTATRR